MADPIGALLQEGVSVVLCLLRDEKENLGWCQALERRRRQQQQQQKRKRSESGEEDDGRSAASHFGPRVLSLASGSDDGCAHAMLASGAFVVNKAASAAELVSSIAVTPAPLLPVVLGANSSSQGLLDMVARCLYGAVGGGSISHSPKLYNELITNVGVDRC